MFYNNAEYVWLTYVQRITKFYKKKLTLFTSETKFSVIQLLKNRFSSCQLYAVSTISFYKHDLYKLEALKFNSADSVTHI